MCNYSERQHVAFGHVVPPQGGNSIFGGGLWLCGLGKYLIVFLINLVIEMKLYQLCYQFGVL